MKIFANFNIWKKILIILTLFTSMAVIAPKPVQAAFGGELMEPICSMAVGLGDGIIRIMHSLILKQDITLIHVTENGWANVIQAIIVIAAIVVISLALVSGVGSCIGLAGIELLTTAAQATVFFVKATATAGAIGAVLFFAAGAFKEQVGLPLYTLTPENIFEGKIPLFDANFINPETATTKYKEKTNYERSAQNTFSANGKYRALSTDEIQSLGLNFNNGKNITEQLIKELADGNITNGLQIEKDGKTYIKYNYSNGSSGSMEKIMVVDDANASSQVDVDTSEKEIHAISYELQSIISKWYRILQLIAIVGMMSVLVYVGIRIILSSTSPQKAKYKQMLGDWLIGLILIFTMHYIMNFSNVGVKMITNFLKSVNPVEYVEVIEDQVGHEKGKIKKALTDEKLPNAYEDGRLLYDVDSADGYVEWHTNLMGAIRIRADSYRDGSDEAYIGYSIMYIAMVIYTMMFCYTYIKRVIYLAFLTLIAPLVALTYPIDKVNDGSAQGFNMWFKEYIFNLLIQPMHLLIYTILVSSAYELATQNWIYSLVALGFIGNAESIIRKLFNFSKAETPGVMTGAAGAALTMTGMRWVFGHMPGRGGRRDDRDSGSSADESSSQTTLTGTRSNKSVSDLLSSLAGNNAEGDSNQGTQTGSNGGNDSGQTPRVLLNTGNSMYQSVSRAEDGGTAQVGLNAGDSAYSSIGDDTSQWSLNIGDYDGDTTEYNGDNGQAIRFNHNALSENLFSNDDYEQAIADDKIINSDILEDGLDKNIEKDPIYQLQHNNEQLDLDNMGELGEQIKKEQEASFFDKHIKKHFGKGTIGGAALDAASYAIDQNKKKIKKIKPLRDTAKFTGAVLAGGTAALWGIGASLTKDKSSLGETAKLGVEAAAVAGKAGLSIGNTAYDSIANNGAIEEFSKSLNEEGYKKMQAENNRRAIIEKESTIKLIQQKMDVSRIEAKKLADEWSKKYMAIDEKINNPQDWINLEKMQKQKIRNEAGQIVTVSGTDQNGNPTTRNTYSLDEAIAAYKIKKRSGVSGKDKEKAIKQIKTDYPDISDEQAKTYYRTAKVLDNIENG